MDTSKLPKFVKLTNKKTGNMASLYLCKVGRRWRYRRWAGAWDIGFAVKKGKLLVKDDHPLLRHLNGTPLIKTTKKFFIKDNQSILNERFYGTKQIDV